MPFDIPNEADEVYSGQSRLDSTDLDALVAALSGTGVVSGCAVTAQGSPDMTVAVAAGVIAVAGAYVAVTGGNVTVTAAHGSLDRKDIVVVSNAGVKSVVAGTAATLPVKPAIPANSVMLVEIFVPANDTDIDADQIGDRRVDILTRPLLIDKKTTTADATNTSAEITLYSKTIPANLLGSTGVLRLTLWGEYLNQEGSTRDLTLRLKFGGTTHLATGLLSLSSDADIRAWKIIVIVENQATNVQRINGHGDIGGVATESWDELAAGGVGGRALLGHATGAIDTTADRDLVFTAQNSVASTNISMVLRGATLELL